MLILPLHHQHCRWPPRQSNCALIFWRKDISRPARCARYSTRPLPSPSRPLSPQCRRPGAASADFRRVSRYLRWMRRRRSMAHDGRGLMLALPRCLLATPGVCVPSMEWPGKMQSRCHSRSVSAVQRHRLHHRAQSIQSRSPRARIYRRLLLHTQHKDQSSSSFPETVFIRETANSEGEAGKVNAYKKAFSTTWHHSYEALQMLKNDDTSTAWLASLHRVCRAISTTTVG